MTATDHLSPTLLRSVIESASDRGVFARRVARRYREMYGAGMLDSLAVETNNRKRV